MFRYLTLAVVILSGSSVYACDGVQALSGGCYSQQIRQRIVVERQVVPQYQIVERVVEQPVYVQRIEKVQRVEKIVERQRAYPLRSSLRAPARIVERVVAPRQKVIRRERIVERQVY